MTDDSTIYILGKLDYLGHLTPHYLFNSKAALDNFIKDDNNSYFLFKRGRPEDLLQQKTWYIGHWIFRIVAGLDLNEHSWTEPISLTHYIEMEKKLE
jgi:hypothetical protein